MNEPTAVSASFLDGRAKPPASNSLPPQSGASAKLPALGPLYDSMAPCPLQSMGLVRAAGPAQLCD
jgi:hypothetical protein